MEVEWRDAHVARTTLTPADGRPVQYTEWFQEKRGEKTVTNTSTTPDVATPSLDPHN